MELALALPVVVMALLLVLQVALLARSQVLVVHAAREGARAAAVGEPADATATPGLVGGRVAVHRRGGHAPGELVTVAVAYRAPTDVPLVGALLGDVDLRAAVTMRVEGPT